MSLGQDIDQVVITVEPITLAPTYIVRENVYGVYR